LPDLWAVARRGTATATYYDVLGVPPTASHEEVKRAYTSRSLKHRPDEEHADDPAAREAAAWRRKELDEAWSTLRSPASRAAYDQSLDPEAAAATLEVDSTWVPTGAWAGRDYSRRNGDGNGSGGAGASRVWFTEPEVAELSKVDPDAPARPRHRVLAVGPLAVGAVVLILILLVISRLNTDRADVTIQTRERFPKSACVNVQRGDDGQNVATEVPCGGPHTGRIVDKVDTGSSCPPHTEYTELAAYDVVLCLQR
jgi:curved DNA-binding protein CbpA